MSGTVKALRVLWLVLMAVLAVLMLTGLISGVGTLLYAAAVLAVVVTEQVLRARSEPR
jgi:phosphate starvation-inducible membrane PsiE